MPRRQTATARLMAIYPKTRKAWSLMNKMRQGPNLALMLSDSRPDGLGRLGGNEFMEPGNRRVTSSKHKTSGNKASPRSTQDLVKDLIGTMALTTQDQRLVEHICARWVRVEDILETAAGPREPIGELLVKAGRITRRQLDQALAEQQQGGEKLGQILVRKSWLSEPELAALLAFQERLGTAGVQHAGPLQLGNLLVSAGKITSEQLQDGIRRQRESKKRIGEALVEAGYTTEDQITQGLTLQRVLLGAVVAALLLLSLAPDFVGHAAIFEQQMPVLEHLDYRCTQIGVGPRLGDEPEDPGIVDRANDAVQIRIGGEHHPRRIRLQLLDHRQQCRTVHLGHPVVRDDDVDRVAAYIGDRVVRRRERHHVWIGNGGHRCPVHAHATQRAQHVGFVVNNEQSRHVGNLPRSAPDPSGNYCGDRWWNRLCCGPPRQNKQTECQRTSSSNE